MQPAADLSVRQHERHLCDSPCRVAVAASCAEAVRLVRVGLGGADARIVDYSQGGLGLRSTVYFPQTCQLRITVPIPGEAAVALDARVQRVAMLDRTPAYYIGTSFDHSTEAHREAALRALEMLRAAGGKAVGHA
jgi:hypothetical protein